MAADRAQLKLRLPEALRLLIERESQETGASMNTIMVRRLEQSYDRERLVDDLVARLTGGKRPGY